MGGGGDEADLQRGGGVGMRSLQGEYPLVIVTYIF